MAPGNAYDWDADMALDPIGNVYFAGGLFEGRTTVTRKYLFDDTEDWSSFYEDVQAYSVTGVPIGIDAGENAYVVAQAHGDLCYTLLIKYNQSGTPAPDDDDWDDDGGWEDDDWDDDDGATVHHDDRCRCF